MERAHQARHQCSEDAASHRTRGRERQSAARAVHRWRGHEKRRKVQGGTFGLGISNNIIDAYSFIVSNYENGDEIFLFGFSRDAFTARSIAGLIHNLGVLKRYNLPLSAEAYNHYKDKTDDWKPNGTEADKYRCKNCHSWPTKIKFLGVWDTVGALGAPYGELLGYVVNKLFKCSFNDVELSKSVDSAYHALAADERRWPFRPTPIELTDYHKERNEANLAKFDFPLYAQKWFPGVHSSAGATTASVSPIAFLNGWPNMRGRTD
jgi:uncharacterized protein (DUF2235 family)